MINITRFDCAPNPATCGLNAIITVEVSWAGPAKRTIIVDVDIPNPCTFSGQNQLHQQKNGGSVLRFTFTGQFNCPSGQHGLLLKATATDVNSGESTSSQTFVTVNCP